MNNSLEDQLAYAYKNEFLTFLQNEDYPEIKVLESKTSISSVQLVGDNLYNVDAISIIPIKINETNFKINIPEKEKGLVFDVFRTKAFVPILINFNVLRNGSIFKLFGQISTLPFDYELEYDIPTLKDVKNIGYNSLSDILNYIYPEVNGNLSQLIIDKITINVLPIRL